MKGALSGNTLVAVGLHNVGIDIVIRGGLVFFAAQDGPVLVKGHDVGVAVEAKVAWVRVEFFKMFLGLGHVLHNFELAGQASLYLLEPKFLQI